MVSLPIVSIALVVHGPLVVEYFANKLFSLVVSLCSFYRLEAFQFQLPVEGVILFSGIEDATIFLFI